MSDWQERQQKVLLLAANRAFRLPRLDSGFWHHHDVRDNLYDSMHLFAASTNSSLQLSYSREEGINRAEEMLAAVLALQNKEPGDSMYGHWPLNLGSEPQSAKFNTLPVELTGSLIAWFYSEFGSVMNNQLSLAFEEAMRHIYLGNYYRQPVSQFNHHESKYISQQLIWGQLFQDQGLAQQGKANLKLMLNVIQANGMREYGALPWFWHWVQSFASARALVKDAQALQLLDEMINYLWRVRAANYLRGAWTGSHSRVLPHDVPADRNNLFDYIQFGDFELPSSISRLEAAGLIPLSPADQSIIADAVNRTEPSEVRKKIPLDPEHIEKGCLHSYTWITANYGLGGVWERKKEYLNEQHRWDVTLPVRKDGTANQAFFFHPENGHKEGDPRQQSDYSQVLLHRNIAVSLFSAPNDPTVCGFILGVLPHGDWLFRDQLIVGRTSDVYLVFHLMHDYTAATGRDYTEVRSSGRLNGVAVEVIDNDAAVQLKLANLSAVLEKAEAALHEAVFTVTANGGVRFTNKSLTDGQEILFEISTEGDVVDRLIGGQAVDFDDYTING